MAASSMVDCAVWSKSLEHLCPVTQYIVDKWADEQCKIPKRKQQKGYSNWIEGYVHDIEVKQHDSGCFVRGKCNPSMRKNNSPYQSKVKIFQTPGVNIGECSCDCKAGNGHCTHVIGLLYELCHYVKKGYKCVPPVISKTELPQTWHVPHRQEGINSVPIDTLIINKVNQKKKTPSRKVVEGVLPKVFCPAEQPVPAEDFTRQLLVNLLSINSNAQALLLLPDLDEPDNLDMTTTKYNVFPTGSVLSYQQARDTSSPDEIINHQDAPSFPLFASPLKESEYHVIMTKQQQETYNGLGINSETANLLEENTRKQAGCYLWKSARQGRLTSSIFKRIVSRRKDFEKLAGDLMKSKRVVTQAMQHGIDHEPIAAKNYADIRQCNVYLCGFVVNPNVPHLGASPDRKVFDPTANPQFGLLEIKCPSVNFFSETKYLKERADGVFKLSKSDGYYMQVMGQMAITGMMWCDFFVQAKNDYHLERIHFDPIIWKEMETKLDQFFFEHYLKVKIV